MARFSHGPRRPSQWNGLHSGIQSVESVRSGGCGPGHQSNGAGDRHAPRSRSVSVPGRRSSISVRRARVSARGFIRVPLRSPHFHSEVQRRPFPQRGRSPSVGNGRKAWSAAPGHRGSGPGTAVVPSGCRLSGLSGRRNASAGSGSRPSGLRSGCALPAPGRTRSRNPFHPPPGAAIRAGGRRAGGVREGGPGAAPRRGSALPCASPGLYPESSPLRRSSRQTDERSRPRRAAIAPSERPLSFSAPIWHLSSWVRWRWPSGMAVSPVCSQGLSPLPGPYARSCDRKTGHHRHWCCTSGWNGAPETEGPRQTVPQSGHPWVRSGKASRRDAVEMGMEPRRLAVRHQPVRFPKPGRGPERNQA